MHKIARVRTEYTIVHVPSSCVLRTGSTRVKLHLPGARRTCHISSWYYRLPAVVPSVCLVAVAAFELSFLLLLYMLEQRAKKRSRSEINVT